MTVLSYVNTVCRRTTKLNVVTYMGRELISRESAKTRPTPQGGGSQRFPILGVLFFYAYTLLRRTSKFHMVTDRGRGLVLRCSATTPPKGAEAQRSPFLEGVGVIFYLCLHPLSQNYQI